VLTAVSLTLDIAETLRGIPRAHIPDMPDRMIAATAVALGVSLVSRDQRIQSSAVPTIW
jgi:PIN domain nuclease of toxin-antitoxin system